RHKLKRFGVAYGFRKEVSRAAVGHEADFHEDLPEFCFVRGHDHIARQGVVAADSYGMTVNAGNDGLWQGAHGKDGGVGDGAEHGGYVYLAQVPVAKGLKVRAGTEGVARACKNHYFALVVCRSGNRIAEQ